MSTSDEERLAEAAESLEAEPTTPIEALCIGEVLIDLFATPGRVAAGIAGARGFRPMLGGAPANVAVGLARQGVSTALLAKAGRDGFGERIRRDLRAEGVHTAYLGSSSARTGLAFVARDREGDRHFLFYRDGTADRLVDTAYVERLAPLLSRCRLLHFCGNGLAEQPMASAVGRAIELAKAGGAAISFDLNLRFHLWPSAEAAGAAARGLLPLCDVVKADPVEARAVCGEEDPERAAAALCALGPALAAVTLGPRGAVYHCAAGGGKVPGVDVQCIDSTGAGDGFSATLAAGLLGRSGAQWLSPTGEEARRLVERACWAGAQVCRHVGAIAGLPRLAELDDALA